MSENRGEVKAETEHESEEVRRLKAQVFQLKNIIKKLTNQSNENDDHSNNESNDGEVYTRKRKKKGREFDPSLYKRRHLMLRYNVLHEISFDKCILITANTSTRDK